MDPISEGAAAYQGLNINLYAPGSGLSGIHVDANAEPSNVTLTQEQRATLESAIEEAVLNIPPIEIVEMPITRIHLTQTSGIVPDIKSEQLATQSVKEEEIVSSKNIENLVEIPSPIDFGLFDFIKLISRSVFKALKYALTGKFQKSINALTDESDHFILSLVEPVGKQNVEKNKDNLQEQENAKFSSVNNSDPFYEQIQETDDPNRDTQILIAMGMCEDASHIAGVLLTARELTSAIMTPDITKHIPRELR